MLRKNVHAADTAEKTVEAALTGLLCRNPGILVVYAAQSTFIFVFRFCVKTDVKEFEEPSAY
jgi:hypothetical protein